MKLRSYGTKYRCAKDRRGSRRGFSLVELIVVLAIIAILASVAAFGMAGYLKRSKYNQNCQNAITVYQAAQNAISQKTLNGTIDEWTKQMLSATGQGFDAELISNLETNGSNSDSIQKKAALTYNPNALDGSEGERLQGLLSSYFYDQTIFNGTMTVVFDVYAINNNGNIEYSANVDATYYSSQNDTTGRWDADCLGDSSNKLEGNNSYVLPQITPDSYRAGQSFVGYFDGSEASITGPVAVPFDQNESGYVFTLRNGETLDLTWGFFDDPAHNKSFTVKLIDQDDPDNSVVLTIDESALIYNPSDANTLNNPQALAFATSNDKLPNNASLSAVQHEYESVSVYSTDANNNITYTIDKDYVEGVASIKVGEGESAKRYLFPIRITEVKGDRRAIIPEGLQNGYTTYTISLDCIMNRIDYVNYPTGNADHDKLYSIDRLFGTTPRNIAAYMEGTGLTASFAQRAYDDPIHMTGTVYDGHTRYVYSDLYGQAAHDTAEKCVVNTLFSDLVYDNYGTRIEGSFTSDAGGTALITAYRHLSNIRIISDPNTVIDYKIARDLDWYTPANTSIDSETGASITSDPVSQVRVYLSYANSGTNRTNLGYNNATCHSPVENNQMKVVSFPALHELYQNKSLSSLSNSEGDDAYIYAINSVQMRAASFYCVTDSSKFELIDKGFGLICENRGTVYNIYANNLNLVVVSIKDGSTSDYSGSALDSCIIPSSVVSMSLNTRAYPFGTNFGKTSTDNKDIIGGVPVGGLIGKNSGTVGLPGAGISDGINTIRMSNCIVMNSLYWSIYNGGNNNLNKKPVGGIIGVNNNGSHTYGLLEMRGAFAIVGRDKVGGIMGQTLSSVGARLVVDGTPFGEAEFNLPVNNLTNGNRMSCVIVSKNTLGGAIGLVGADPDNNMRDLVTKSREVADEDVGFNCEQVEMQFALSELQRDPVTGALIFSDRTQEGHDYFNINVNLPQYSILLEDASFEKESAGGAIGVMNGCRGDYLSVRVRNDAQIVINNTSKTNIYCGGAIGDDRNSTTAVVYVDVVNGEHSRIGYKNDTTGPCSAGGAFGRILRDNVNTIGTDSGLIVVNVENNGTVVARKQDGNGDGSGGAVGLVYVNKNDHRLNLELNSVINTGSKIICTGGSAGGAIGYLRGIKTGSLIGDIAVTSGVNSNSSVSPLIRGTSDIGGAIGRVHAYSPMKPADRETAITVDFTAAACEITSSLTSGDGTIGGAIGRLYELNNYQQDVPVIVHLGSSLIGKDGLNRIGGGIGENSMCNSNYPLTVTIDGSGKVFGNDCIGTGIGYNTSTFSGDITTVMSGNAEISGAGNVGGIIGSSNKNTKQLDGTLTATLNDNAKVHGTLNVGGGIGYDNYVINGNMTIAVNGSSEIYADSTDGQYVGGAIGYLNNSMNGNITVTTSADTKIYGTDYVGGAIGKNVSCSVFGYITTTIDGSIEGDEYVGGAVGSNGKKLDGTITSTINGSISGTAYIGGAVGISEGESINGEIIATVSGPITGSSDYIGGAIGRNNKPVNNSITTTISAEVSGNDYVGGVIGYNGSTVSSALYSDLNADTIIKGQNNIGGVIGYNGGTVSGTITAALKATAYIDGHDNVGGAIGDNESTLNEAVSVSFIGSSYIDAHDNAGGAIGYSNKEIGHSVTTTMSGTSYIKGNNKVGGVIGLSNKNVSAALNCTMSGSACVDGNNAVGGVIGENNASVSSALGITLSGSAHIGSETTLGTKVGGAVGYNRAALSGGASATIAYQSYVAGDNDVGGAIGLDDGNASVSVTITCNNAVRGLSCIGGAIGRIGDTANPTLDSVSVTVNRTARPIKQISGVTDAYIGGVIGQINNGTVNNITLSGSGSTVNLANIMPSGLKAAYPNKNYYNSIAVYGSGNYIGGLIGSVQGGGKVINMSVDSIGLCVAATNTSSLGLGGWIGRCNGQLGTSSSNKATYEVDTVKVVYSQVGNAGGFCGEVGTGDITTKSNIYANVDMTLNGSNVNGRMQIGGIYGVLDKAIIYGDMIVDLTNNTRLGDYYGNYSNGTITNNDICICVDVGGAVGLATNNTQFEAGKIAVEFTGNSVIFAGEINDIPYSNAGVGGAFGCVGDTSDSNAAKQSLPRIGVNYDDSRSYSTRASDMGNSSRYISVISDSSSPCIISNLSHAGGVVGHMFSGSISYAYSTAVIYNRGGNATGGFVGHMDKGFITHCYCGGHTVGGQYVNGSDNIVGDVNVGGFVGYTAKDASCYIDFCYSTASVRGTNYVGGFFGKCETDPGLLNLSFGMINTCYCTGRVTATSNTNYVGAFGGYAEAGKTLQNTQIGFSQNINNYALNYYSSSLNRVGQIRYNVILVGQGVIEWGNANSINNGGTYTAYPYDSQLGSSGSAVNFPYRAFVGGTHHGDWPTLPNARITINSSNTTVTLTNTNFVYNGTPIELQPEEISVVYTNRNTRTTLVNGRDYIVSYENNVNAGFATVTVTGIGNNYMGSVSTTFEITKVDLTISEVVFDPDLTVDEPTMEYTGLEVEPQVVSITCNGVALVAGQDYDISYDNNIGPTPDALVTITGTNNYEGALSWTYKIVRPLTDEGITVVIPDGPYDLDADGNIIPKDGLIVSAEDGVELVAGQDYTIQYLTTENAGEGNIVITGTDNGNYTGTRVYTIAIALPPEDPNTDPADPSDTEPEDPNANNGTEEGGSGGESDDQNSGTDEDSDTSNDQTDQQGTEDNGSQPEGTPDP